MAEGMAEQINGLACDIFKKRTKGANAYNSHEFNQLYRILKEWSKRNAGHLVNNFNVDSGICFSAFHDAILKSLDSYDGVKDFLPFYKKIFRNKLIDELRKENIHGEALSLNFDIYDDEGDSQGVLGDTIADDSMRDNIKSQNKIESFYQRFATVCIEEKKNHNGKKRVCYPPLFFTDKLVFQIFDGQTEMWFNDIVKRNSNKFDEAVVNEFLNTLVTGMCHSVTDIKKYGCKPLSEFTGKQEDMEKPCCGEKPNYHVFNSFLKKYYKDNDITPSAFTNQKKELAKMLKDIEKELRCD